ncbi:MAG TPA: glycosyltransferase [Candidatus Deferrimicrobium sp.]|nr:glycosyltransferase [Candidatus Deferrimicrobium sp.]
MKLLIIDEEFPFPLNSGKRIRTFNLVKGLSRRHRITYLAYGSSDSVGFSALMSVGIIPVAVPPPDRRQSGGRFYLRLLANLISSYPYVVTSHYTNAFRQQLQRLISSDRFDVIVCEWTPYALFLREVHGIKKVIVAHNIESSIWKRYEEFEANPFRRAYITIQRAKVERFEQRCFAWADGATAVCETEAEQIRGFGVPYSVEVVANGVDLEYFVPSQTEVDPHEIVFTGSMDWRPNQDAVSFFVHKIFPEIRARVFQATFTVVGRNPTAAITALRSLPGITVTGTVDDVRPYLARAAVCVVPLRIGGGSRLKVLEALAMSKAVVSTTVGAEGLRVTDEQDILIADTPQNFAEKVVALMRDADRRAKLGKLGRELVENTYGWECLSERFGSYLASVAGQP